MTDSPPPSNVDPTRAAPSSEEAAGAATAGDAAHSAAPSPDSQLTPEDMDLLVRAAAEAETTSGEPHPGSAGRRGRGRNGARAAGDEDGPGEPLDLPEFASASTGPVSVERISMLSDVTLNVKIELGRTRMLVEDVLRLDSGSVVELDKLAGDPVDVFANDRLIARGEVLVLNDSFCVRISEVLAGDPHRIV